MEGRALPCRVYADFYGTEWKRRSWEDITSAIRTSCDRTLCPDEEVHMFGVVLNIERTACLHQQTQYNRSSGSHVPSVPTEDV